MAPDIPPTTHPAVPPSPEEAEKKDIDDNKDIAAFSYLWIMSIVVYFLRRNSPFVRFHAKQAIVLFILSLIVFFIPILNRILALGILALMVMGFLNAAQGKKKDIPIVGPLSRREIGLREAWRQLVAKIVWVYTKIRSMIHKEKKPESSSSNPSPPQP